MKRFSENLFPPKYLVVVILFVAVVGLNESYAQRTVIKTPRRTVVSTPTRTTVVKKTRVVTAYPRGAVVVRHGGASFHCFRGVYYRPVAGGYVIVPAPVGLRVKVLPPVYRSFVVAGKTYFYSGGAYYIRYWGGYRVTTPPASFILKTLPATPTTVIIKGVTYYRVEGVHYEKVVLESGDIQYCKVIIS